MKNKSAYGKEEYNLHSLYIEVKINDLRLCLHYKCSLSAFKVNYFKLNFYSYFKYLYLNLNFFYSEKNVVNYYEFIIFYFKLFIIGK